MQEFFIFSNGQQHGPYSLEDVDQMLQSELITGEDHFWREGADDWLPISQLPGYVPPKAAQIPPPLPPTQNHSLPTPLLRRSQGRAGDSTEVPPLTPAPIYSMNGVSGILEVYADKVAITPKGVMGFFTQGLKGTKAIPFYSIVAIQFKEAGFTSGYLQFTIPGGNESRRGVFSAASDENTFMFTNVDNGNITASTIRDFIESRVQELRAPKAVPSGSFADELQKLASLRRDGLLSEAEFAAAKERLLR